MSVPTKPPATQPDRLESLSPATGEVVGSFPIHDDAHVQSTVDKARAAAEWWAGLGFDGRKQRLLAFKRLVVKRMDDIAGVMHAETGKPIDDALLEVVGAIEHIDWAAKHAPEVLGSHKVKPSALFMNIAATVQYKPLGVVGVIGPWNYPIFTPMGSIAYALAAGNAVVFKPSEHTPGVGVWIAETFAEVVPEHPVLQVITGFGPTGAALCRSGVDKLAFTGSTGTGKKVMAACAESLTPVVIEAGGKDAVIVADDADVDAAAEAVAFGAMGNAGQTCVGIERAYVTEAVFDQFVGKVAEIAAGIKVGSQPDAQLGPITMPSQVDVIRRHIDDAIKRGGTAVFGGAESVRPPFVHPVVLTNVPEDSDAVREETFGPTITINRVKDVDEAVTRANATRYGLGSAVYSRNKDTANDIARRLRGGMTSVNSVMSFALVGALPFGGVGDSGFGRIHGADGLREFATPKSIARQKFKPPVNLLSFGRKKRDMKTTLRLVKLLHGRGK